MPTHPTRLTRTGTRLAHVLALLISVVAVPAPAQVFFGTLADTDEQLGQGQFYDTFTLHCVGGEAFRLTLRGNGFDGRILLLPPEGEMVAGLDPRLEPSWGTSLDVIAKHPGDYTVIVTSIEPNTTDLYQLMLTPLTQGQWVTDRQGVGQSEGGELAFGLIALPGPGRLLAYAEGLSPTITLEAGQAGGGTGRATTFAQGSGAALPVEFTDGGLPLATVALAGGRDGEVHWAYQRFVPQETVEQSRARTPQARVDGVFPEGSRETSFDLTLAEGQFFFAFVAADGFMDLEGALEGEDEGPSPQDYRVSVVGPDGQPVGNAEGLAYMSQFHAPVAGQYTIRVVGTPQVPDTFQLAYSIGRDVPALDAPIRWSSTETRLGLSGTLDDDSDRLAERRSNAYGIPVKAGDRVVVDVWSAAFLPSITVATPDEQGHSNQGFQGSDMHARVDFVAQADGLCTVFVVGRTTEDAGDYNISVAVAPAEAGPPAPDPFQAEDDTTDGWSVRNRSTLTLDAQSQQLEGKAYRVFELEATGDEQLRIVITGEGFRVDAMAALPDDTVIEGEYDPATNRSVVVLPAGTQGTVQFVAFAANPGELGDYTEELQVREE